ncbi:LysE family translocator [Thalassotalea marina]|uniref:Lysine transporter LysE n=1 Tax=Thalassotalea marina TaxID=1673741 RepID=A0A919BNE7_9GAMM|nr:LysE family translocator [Thalassotalea marina]GHF99111.1 lysine transporter LysE [Thalassotalea marina]
MTIDIIMALSLFAFVSSITPGPNNLMLMTSGVNFGLKLTLPHLFGVAIGFTVMIVLVGAGIVQLFDAWPMSYSVLKVLSISYLLYLAYKIATATAINKQDNTEAKPMTLVQAALFQWVNPKAWTMALTAVSVYSPTGSIIAILIVALVFGAINLPCIGVWAMLGDKMQSTLNQQKYLIWFNRMMALLLVLSLLVAV